MLRFHNTRTGTTDQFTPLQDGAVSVYTCGPTVYNELTVGNWVAYVRWDLLVRTLRDQGLTVNRVMNITDVGHLTSDADEGEDKMQKGARREGITAWDVAERYTNRFLEGMTALHLVPPETICKATEHIQEQIQLVKTLEDKGYTYTINDGVYFDTSKFASYADFAHLDLDAMRAGARVEFNQEKRNPSDFALWKFSPLDETRDMEWDSPWGKGFPGWHIECSAMAMHYLGETLDIHTGGIDHIPVHHTNEIAQSEAASDKRFANVWLHNNFLLVEGTKISKSLNNGFTLDDLRQKGFTATDFKMFVLQSHYRTESNFTWENLEAAAHRLKRWRNVAALRHQSTSTGTTESTELAINAVREALSSDLASPLALTIIEESFDKIDSREAVNLQAFFEYIDDVLGLEISASTPDISEQEKQLISDRETARSEKRWGDADSARDELALAGIGVNDHPSGSRWYYL